MTMRVDSMIQSLRILVKADAMIAEAAFKTRLSQIALHGMALGIAVFGLVMIGLAIFFALQDIWGTIRAAVAVGLGSLMLAGVIVAFSSYRRPGRDLQLAHDMHKMALDSLLEEARLAGQDFSSIRGLMRSAAQGTLLGTLAPIVSLVLRLLKRSDAAAPSPDK
jgi:hypothetical protein